MARQYEVDPVTFITIGTIGPPGKRVFHLQAGDEEQLITLVIEKEQAAALAEGVAQLMTEIGEKLELPPADPQAANMDMDLHEPILPAFRVAQLGLGYDEERGMVVVLAQELLMEGENDDPAVARFVTTRDQILALSDHAREVITQGRPICGNCGQPIDPDGHFCPKSNGHGDRVMWA